MAKVEKAEKASLVKVMSLRPGDIVLPDGVVFKLHSIIEVSEELAAWLEVSFKGLVKRV